MYPSVAGINGAGIERSIDDMYGEAYALLDQAVCYDEVGQTADAKQMYEKGLTLIEEAGSLKNASKSELYGKMNDSRRHIVERLASIERSSGVSAGSKAPALYPDVPEVSAFDAISGALYAMGDVRHADEIFCIEEGVQIVFIDEEQNTVYPQSPSVLKIFKFSDSSNSESASGPPAYLQVGNWIYPLMPGVSPVLHSSYGAFIFPDTSHPGSSVGIILPSDLDASTTAEFETILKSLTDLRDCTAPLPLSDSQQTLLKSRMARFLLKTADVAVWGIEKSGTVALDMIRKQSQKMQDTSKDPKNVSVDPRVQTGVHYLRKGAKVGVRVSGYVVNKLGDLAAHIGSQIAGSATSFIRKTGGEGASKKFEGVLEVGQAGVAGAANIWMSLERSGQALAKALVNESTTVVKTRYGDDAAVLADNLGHTVYHTGTAAWNIHEMGPKSIAKRCAKKTGIAILADLSGSGASSRPGTAALPSSSEPKAITEK